MEFPNPNKNLTPKIKPPKNEKKIVEIETQSQMFTKILTEIKFWTGSHIKTQIKIEN